MESSETFLAALCWALQRVPNGYYRFPNANRTALNAVTEPLNEHVADLEEISFVHGERAFCYELYHHIRNRLDALQWDVPEWDDRLVLQGELRKPLLEELAREYFNVQHLDKEFIPDFLLHVPGNFDHQEVVMEVKADPDLGFFEMKADLLKIQQFITRYRYRTGVFLTVNTDPTRICKLLGTPANLNWIRDNIGDPECIYLVCAYDSDSPALVRRLSDIVGR